MAETIRLMGEGGAVFEYGLPLSPNIEKQWANQSLLRLDEDGAVHEVQYEDYVAQDSQDSAEDDEDGEDNSQNGPVPMPNKAGPGSSLDAWVTYACSVDPDLTASEAEDMGRAALISKYGN